MRRPQLLALLQDGKLTNGGAADFMISVPQAEMSSVLTILFNFKAEGLISDFTRCPPPEENCVDIFGYTGP